MRGGLDPAVFGSTLPGSPLSPQALASRVWRVDPQSKKFTGPPDQIKKDIASIKANKIHPGGAEERGPGAA
jgi:hypothetical protein